MTAATDALVSGDFTAVPVGAESTATFSVEFTAPH